jgi:UDP-N-acetylenolpyruvoylglucosamine reductase
MSSSGTRRARKMVTIHNLNEMKAAVQENDSQTKMLVLGLGEAILTTCGMARTFLGNNPSFGDEPKGGS